jgi:hypothetical protein
MARGIVKFLGKKCGGSDPSTNDTPLQAVIHHHSAL